MEQGGRSSLWASPRDRREGRRVRGMFFFFFFLSLGFLFGASVCLSVCATLCVCMFYLSVLLSLSSFLSVCSSINTSFPPLSPAISIYLNPLPLAHSCHSLDPPSFSWTYKHTLRNVRPDLRPIRPRGAEVPLCHRSRYRHTFPVYFPSTRVTSLRNPTAHGSLVGEKKQTFRGTIFGIFSPARIAEL